MAHHLSAKHRIRRNKKREIINRARRSRIKTFIKKVEVAVDAKDKTAAEAAFMQAQPEIHRGVTKGVLHRNNAARKVSRLQKLVSNLA
ncbi:MAG: 30S ribosomal protein S20 [Pseudomonadota bacterium]|nr:30S ribosomal protein S20 [Pseudomonadota bacterium]